jgi:hypothetical protein
VESPLKKSSSCGDIFLRREKLAWEVLKTILYIYNQSSCGNFTSER